MKNIILTAAFAATSLFATSANAEDLKFYTEDWSFHNFKEKGMVAGAQTEILREVLAKSGVKAEIILQPWARSYSAALKDSNACVYTTNVTEARENLFKWVRPIGYSSWVMYRKTGNTAVEAKSLDEVKSKGYSVGVYRDDVREQYLKEKGGFKLEVANTDELSYRKTQAGRVDIFFSGPEGLMSIQKHSGSVNVEPLFVVNETSLGLACNKGVSDATIAKMQSALDDMIKEDKINMIEAKVKANFK